MTKRLASLLLLLLDFPWQRDAVDVEPNVHSNVPEEKADQVLVPLLGVNHAVAPAVGAVDELEALAGYYPGAEAKYRYAALLKEAGEIEKSRAVLSQMLNDAELSTKHFRKTQKEWLTLAKRDLENW